MDIKIRTLRIVNVIGDTALEVDTEKDAKALATYLMQNVPSSTLRRVEDILFAFSESQEPSFSKFMKELK